MGNCGEKGSRVKGGRGRLVKGWGYIMKKIDSKCKTK